MKFSSALIAVLSIGTTVDAVFPTAGQFASTMVANATDGDVTLVSGNEGGDADSIITAFTYAYLLAADAAENDSDFLNGTSVVSFNEFHREDMPLRPEVVLIFEAAGVDWQSLVYMDDTETESLIERTTQLVLTDHNAVDSSLIHLGDNVMQIMDHHIDQEHSLNVTGENREIAFNGTTGKATAASAATVICEKYHERDHGPELLAMEDGAIAKALLSVVLLDGRNKLISDGGLLTSRDVACLDKMKNITSMDAAAATVLYEQLSAVKTNVSMWEDRSAHQILRYDFKEFTSTNGERKVGISSAPSSLKSLTAKEDWMESVSEHAADYDLYVVMTKSLDADGKLHKELLLTACTQDLVDDAATFFAAYNNGILQMKPKEASPVPDFSKAFDQINTDPSRKVVGPVSQRFLDTLTEAPDCASPPAEDETKDNSAAAAEVLVGVAALAA